MDILTAQVLKLLTLNTTTTSMWNFVIWPSWGLATTSPVSVPTNLTAQRCGNHTKSIMGKYTIPAYVQFIQLLQYYEGTYIICSKSLITFCFSERVHKGIKVAFSNICTTKYSADPEESKVNHSIRIYSIGERL